MIYIKEKLLVTGADGFIGSHLTETLVRQGYEVKAFVQYNSFNSWGWLDNCASDVTNNIEVVLGDVRDQDSVDSAMEGCRSVLHLAALIAIPYSYSAPESYISTNVNGTLNVLRAARAKGVEKIVHTSTSEVYGSAKFIPITEEHPIQSQSPYSASKTAADQLALSFFKSFQLPVTIIRPFNVFGPRQSARALIPTVISQIAAGLPEIRLGSLSPTREFNYVEDTVEGFIAALKGENTIGEVINIGNGFEISIGDIARLIIDLMESKVQVVTDVSRIRPKQSEVDRLCSDNSKARNMLGWSPKYAGTDGLTKGLVKTISWFRDPENLKHYRPGNYTI